MSHGHKHPTGFEDYHRGRFFYYPYTGDGTQDRLIYPVAGQYKIDKCDLFMCMITILRYTSTGSLSRKYTWVYYGDGDHGWDLSNQDTMLVAGAGAVDITENTITLNAGNANITLNVNGDRYVLIIQGPSP